MSVHRLARLIAASAVVAVGLVLAPASAAPAHADVDDFSYSSWDARYELGLDPEGRAVLRVEEHLVVEFPDHDQNKGIVRGLAQRYQGADLGTTVLSVTDEEGSPVPYETEEDDGTLFVLTGDDDYVRGTTDYVITYEMHDVMLTAKDTGDDEFYWDLLPLDSTQDIGSFRAEIVLDDVLSARLTGDTACYSGTEGSTERCEMSGPQTAEAGTMFAVQSGARSAGDGVTVAIGFEADTVSQPEARRANPLADVGPVAGGVGAVLFSAAGWAALAAFRRRHRRATGIVIAQYDVPATMPPLVAAPLIPGARTPVAAEIVHLAVQGDLRIEDHETKRPRLHRVADAPTRDPLDAEALDALFPKAGADIVKIPKASEGFAKRMQQLEQRGVAEAAARGLTTKARSPMAALLQWISLALLAVAVVLAVWSVVQGRESATLGVVAVIVAAAVALISSFVAFARHTVLSAAGAEQYEHLLGVKEFIRVAEADRLRMLQSFSGAERYVRDGVELIHLYERLLPYAILFGMEREWGEVLETRYGEEDLAPAWITGYQTGFFAARLTQFGSTAQDAAHYSAPSSSSSSSFGGSTGGGFSGGGGGGGFSGGR